MFFTCGKCPSRNHIPALSMDRRGYLSPVRRKACGMAARPVGATCEACQSQWQTCVSRPDVGEGNVVRAALRSVQQWPFPFATDFSGMDMAALALGGVLIGDISVAQRLASDIWDQARLFCARNHSPPAFYGDVRSRPMPGPPPLAVYVAGPLVPALGARWQTAG